MITIARPHIRIWPPVYEVLKAVARNHRLQISDLVSTIVLWTSFNDPSSVITALVEVYGLDYEEAKAVALDLRGYVRELIEMMTEEEADGSNNEKERQKEAVTIA